MLVDLLTLIFSQKGANSNGELNIVTGPLIYTSTEENFISGYKVGPFLPKSK